MGGERERERWGGAGVEGEETDSEMGHGHMEFPVTFLLSVLPQKVVGLALGC